MRISGWSSDVCSSDLDLTDARGELARAAWINEADTRLVMETLGAGARFVGGAVRNELMGEPVSDIDIATVDTPEQASALLEAKGIKVEIGRASSRERVCQYV